MNKLFQFAVLALLLASCSSHYINERFIITRYGAKADGTVVTVQIQEAVNAAHANGGGKVVIPPGEFITGTIILKSNVEIYLAPGAILRGSSDTSDYIVAVGRKMGIVYANDCENITISGKGTIDANGTYFHKLDVSHDPGDFDRSNTRQGDSYMRGETVFEDGPIAYDYRPGMTIILYNCSNVTLQDFLLNDSPEWSIRIGECDGVLVNGITIRNNLLVPNSDGLHCTFSRNIRVANCDIQAGDDAFIVSGFPNKINVHGELMGGADDKQFGNKTKYTENVTVSNCIFQSRSAGIRVGYGLSTMRNLVFQNIVIHGSNRGIGLFSREEGGIEDVIFSNIIIKNRLHNGHWWGSGEPIHVSTISRFENNVTGKIKNITFKDIIAESETGIVLYGREDKTIENLVLDNVSLTINNGKYVKTYGGNFDLRPTNSVATDIFKHDIPGIFGGNLENCEIKDCKVYWGENLEDFHSYAIELENSKNIRITNFTGENAFASRGSENIVQENCEGIVVK